MRVPSKPVTSGHEVQEWCLATQHRLARLGKPRKHVARPWPLFSVCWVFKLIFSWKVYGETCPIWKVYGEIWNVVWMFFFSCVRECHHLKTCPGHVAVCRYGEDDCLWPSAQWTLPELVTCASRVAVPTPYCVAPMLSRI